MFRNSSHGLRAARIASLAFAAILIVTAAAPLEASGVKNSSEELRPSADLQFNAEIAPESPPDETIRVHIWIPGFDDDEPVFICSPTPTPNPSEKKSSNHSRFRVSLTGKPRFGKLAGIAACSRMLRMLPWTLHSAPRGRVEFLLPII